MKKVTNDFQIGLFVGRFQPLTIGHCFVIDEALKNCDILIIAIGSSQESRTIKNPFSIETRLEIFNSVYYKEIKDKKMICVGVPDRKVPKDDLGRGEYLFDCIYKKTNLIPNVIFEGSEIARNYWFDNKIKRVTVNRFKIPISGTDIRNYIRNDDYENYKDNVPRAIGSIDWFNKLKLILSEAK